MMEDIKLKPCPFCGGEAKLKAIVNRDIGFTIWVQCGACDAQTTGYCPSLKDEDRSMDNIEECTKFAVKRWNRRAGDTP